MTMRIIQDGTGLSSAGDNQPKSVFSAKIQPAGKPDPELIPNYVDSVFGPDGQLVSAGMKYRPEQHTLAQHVSKAFAEKRWAMLEGACGVGKSIAALVPALHHATPKSRVCIAVHNNNLLDQIYNDIPRVMEITGRKVNYAQVKGKLHYVCDRSLDRLHAAMQAGSVNEKTHPGITQLYNWVTDESDGPNSDLTRYPRKRVRHLEQLVTSDGSTCRKARRAEKGCPYEVTCDFLDQRRRARAADIVVTNFSMLLWNAEYNNQIIGGFDYYILDEAHEFHKVVREKFTTTTSFKKFDDAVTESLRFVNASHNTANQNHAAALNAVRNMSAAVETAQEEIVKFAAVPTPFPNPKKPFEPHQVLLPDCEYPSYVPVIASMENLEKATHAAVAAMQTLGELPTDEPDEPSPCDARIPARELLTIARLEKPRASYISISSRDLRPTIESIPISVAGFINSMFGANINPGTGETRAASTVIAMSATLRVGESWDYAEDNLAMPGNAIKHASAEVFDFKNRALWYVPSYPGKIESKNTDEYNAAASAACRELVTAVGGSTLVLCSRTSDIEVACAALQGLGYAVYKQDDAPPRELARRFKEDPTSCLVGSKTYGTGFDIPGDALRCVAIWKLPFSPRSMLDEYLMRSNRNRWFRENYLPAMCIDYRQWIGRLLRSADDRGIIACLDANAALSLYRTEILKSMPESIRLTRSLSDVSEFMRNHKNGILLRK